LSLSRARSPTGTVIRALRPAIRTRTTTRLLREIRRLLRSFTRTEPRLPGLGGLEPRPREPHRGPDARPRRLRSAHLAHDPWMATPGALMFLNG
jgi:hypothetical protein